jgi:Ca2+/Na+ antiporter
MCTVLIIVVVGISLLGNHQRLRKSNRSRDSNLFKIVILILFTICRWKMTLRWAKKRVSLYILITVFRTYKIPHTDENTGPICSHRTCNTMFWKIHSHPSLDIYQVKVPHHIARSKPTRYQLKLKMPMGK